MVSEVYGKRECLALVSLVCVIINNENDNDNDNDNDNVNNNNNNIIIITLFKSQIILAKHKCSTNWGDCKSNKSNQIR